MQDVRKAEGWAIIKWGFFESSREILQRNQKPEGEQAEPGTISILKVSLANKQFSKERKMLK